MNITKLEQMLDAAKEKPTKRLVVAYGQDDTTIKAVKQATEIGFITATLVGDEKVILSVCKKFKIDPSIFKIVHEPDEMKAGRKAVSLINKGEGDFIMKGLISSDKYLRCILDKEDGLMIPKATLTHVSVSKPPTYHKLLISSDAAFIPKPDIKQKIAITNYLINTAQKLGIEKPRVAIISFTEKANPKIEPCTDAAIIAKMGDRGQIKGAFIDGPLALDVAIDPESVKTKGIKSSVEGNADCLVFPNLEAGNVYYKAMTKLVKCEVASFIAGTKVPTVLPSRGDSDKSKLLSLAFAALVAD